MPGTATRSPGATSPGRNSSLTMMSPASQCLPTSRISSGGASDTAVGQRARVVGVVERRADVVAHPAVDGDVGAHRATVELDRLDGADLVDGARRRPGDRPARLDREQRHLEAPRGALVAHDLGHLGGQLGGVGRVVLGRVGDAEAAAEVELGQRRRRSRRRPGRAARAPVGPPPRSPEESKICEPMWECSPSSSSPSAAWTRRTASMRVAVADREAELLVLVGGGDVLVGVRLDPGGDPDHHAGGAAELAGDRGRAGRSRGRSRR